MQSASIDTGLLQRFESEVWSRVPHIEAGKVTNGTPIVDVTESLLECAKSEYGMDLNKEGVRVYAKLDSRIIGGSVKVRPAVMILKDAISSGRLQSGQTIFEATSGNFGLALGWMGKLGLDVVARVSRKL